MDWCIIGAMGKRLVAAWVLFAVGAEGGNTDAVGALVPHAAVTVVFYPGAGVFSFGDGGDWGIIVGFRTDKKGIGGKAGGGGKDGGGVGVGRHGGMDILVLWVHGE